MQEQEQSQQQLAAIDLGSNSFHLVMARLVDGQVQTLEKRGEKVQLAAGLNAQLQITEEAQGRAFACLERFSQRLKGLPRENVTILGTNTLRSASNSRAFISKANQILGYPIEVIAGIEEARLVYLGVAHALSDDNGKRLVIDIGGGSTEYIIGERFKPLELESLEMGCVAYTDKFFSDGHLSKQNFKQASKAAQQEIQRIKYRYRRLGWDNVVGSSGTIRAANRVLQGYGLSDDGINLKALRSLRDMMIKQAHSDNLELQGIKDKRLRVFPAGVAILIGIFEALNLDTMHYCDAALREGALFDLLGRVNHEDVREKTVASLQSRYTVDLDRSRAVKQHLMALFDQVKRPWKLTADEQQDWLRWSADLFEVGLSVAHSQYHKHGGYLLQHSDMPGFTQRIQARLALLVRGHRRKLPRTELSELPESVSEVMLKLVVLLRIAALLHNNRGMENIAVPIIKSRRVTDIELHFPEGYIEAHPMTEMDLLMEVDYLHSAGIHLQFS